MSKGKYPKWMVTPDDPISPFGCGTTKYASREASMVWLYKHLGRWVGDWVWLAWRNSGYALAYYAKPDFLKQIGINYLRDIAYEDNREVTEALTTDKKNIRVGTCYIQDPITETWLWETTRKFGPFYLITGYRLNPIIDGIREDTERVIQGLDPVRPSFHPNMDGRPIVSLRTGKTL